LERKNLLLNLQRKGAHQILEEKFLLTELNQLQHDFDAVQAQRDALMRIYAGDLLLVGHNGALAVQKSMVQFMLKVEEEKEEECEKPVAEIRSEKPILV
jgi:hypothetical protein